MNYTDITAIIDRSGSMAGLRAETIGGFNSFLERQQEATKNTHSKVVLQIVQFDDQYEPGIPYEVSKHPKLDTNTYQPRGMTALLDAIGKTINAVGARFVGMPEHDRPEKVLFLVITDGFENSSKEFKLTKIKEMLTEQQTKYKWDFIYLGANQDAWDVGSQMGFTAGKTLNTASTVGGTVSAYASAASYSVRTMSAGTADDAIMDSFTEEDKKKQDKEGAIKNS
jgi:hypothetical protein